MLDPGRSMHARQEAMDEVRAVHEEIAANRDELAPEDENLLVKARIVRLR